MFCGGGGGLAGVSFPDPVDRLLGRFSERFAGIVGQHRFQPRDQGFAAGFPLSRYYKNMENSMLICVTEKRTKQQIGMLAEALESIL